MRERVSGLAESKKKNSRAWGKLSSCIIDYVISA